MRVARLLNLALGALALVAALATTAVSQRSAGATLQEAVDLELVAGDLTRAIALYREIASRHPANRPVAAQALANLGRAYEKLGASDATDAYQRLVRDYPEQSSLVQFARGRLAALADPAGAARPDLRLRKVWESIEGFSSVSPDGRYVAFQDWGRHRDPALRGHADWALYDTRDRRIRLVTNRPSLTLVDVYPTGPMIWSPDGQWLAYGLHAVGWTHRELHIVRPDGSDDRRILDNRQMAEVHPMAFSRDNRLVLAALKGWDNVWRIGTVSVRDSSLTIIKTLGLNAPGVLSLSPDNRFIAYAYAMPDSSPTNDIVVLAIDGSSEQRAGQHPANDVNAFWTPGGDHLVFVSNRSGQRAVWSTPWRDGRPAGEPELVYPHLGAMQLRGITGSGALYLAGEGGGTEVFEGALDIGRDSTIADVKRLPSAQLLTNLRPAWSPDGNRIAWLSQRSIPGEPMHLVIRTTSSGAERAYELPFPPGDLRAHRAAWSADGRSVRIQGFDRTRRYRGSFNLDVESGAVTQEPYLRDFAGMAGGSPTEFHFVDDRQSDALRQIGVRLIGQTDLFLLQGDLTFRDGERPLVVRNGVYRIPSFPAFLAASDDSARRRLVEPLIPDGHMNSWRLSPDGTRIAAAVSSDTVMTTNVLYVVPVTGGPARALDRIERRSGDGDANGELSAVRWTPDGKSIVYSKLPRTPRPGESGEVAESWMVDADGGTPRRLSLRLSPYRLGTMDFHPDGRRVAFTEWQNPVTEAWIMDGLPWQKR